MRLLDRINLDEKTREYKIAFGMKKILFCLGLICFSLTAASFNEGQEIYLAFGDSITAGFIAGVGDTLGYTPFLEDLMREEEIPAVVPNYGLGGEMTADGLIRLAGIVETEDGDYCLIMEGTNDISALVPISQTISNLSEMIIVTRQNGVEPVIATLIPRLEQDLDDPFNVWTRALNQEIRRLAYNLEVPLCDQFENFYTHPDYAETLYSDYLHPNLTGYELMAAGWLGTLLYGLPYVSVGDIDGSGRVDGEDLIELGFSFGTTEMDDHFNAACDFNFDGRVDGEDLAILASNFGWRRSK